MRRALAVLAVVGAAAPAAAEELPSGKIGVTGGVRQGLGSISGRFDIGWVVGVEAGWHPASTDRRWSLGVNWSLVWAGAGAGNETENSAGLSSREMTFGVKARLLTGQASPLFLSLGTGLSILRTSVPVPPDDKRSYYGMYVSLGPELYLAGKYLLTLEARVGPIIDAPTSLTVAAGISFGSG